MGQPGDRLAQARAAYRQGRWPEAYAAYTAVRDSCTFTPDDSAALADAAWWLGRVDDCVVAGSAAFSGFLAAGRTREAAMAAVGVAVNHFLRAEGATGSGWVAHATRLLDDAPEGREHGYVTYLLEVEGALDSPDRAAVITAARRVRELGRRHDDTNLVAIGLLGEGRMLVRHGEVEDGMALLDEAMAHVLAGEVVPDWAGNIFCHLMTACHWAESGREAARVCADLADIAALVAAEGHYQVGELARLRGELVAAEHAYQQAHRLGRSPQPGFALLRLAQGRIEAARAATRTALIAETRNRLARARLLAAEAEIALAAGAAGCAAAAADELAEIAERYASPGFTAAARHWQGAVLLAADRVGEALPVLHEARRAWQELQAPYDCARVRVLVADACRRLGDADGAELELAAAAEVFARLGAAPDGAAVAALRGVPPRPGGLTVREREVLACLAAGRSNREIAQALVISEKTVARHLSNIFTKLGVGSRTAAAAWGHRHGIHG